MADKDNNVSVANVSVIIPNFNSATVLNRALESIFNQTLPILEVIIVDDFSDDDERKTLQLIVQHWKNHGLDVFLILNNENIGPGASRNLAIGHSIGKYIAFIDADDVWHREKIKIQYQIMENFSLSMTGHMYVHNITSDFLNVQPKISYKRLKLVQLLFKNPFATPTVMIKRNGFVSFPEQLRYGEDYYCWIKNASVGSIAMINTELAAGFKNSFGESGLSKNIVKMNKGVLQVFSMLYREGIISLYQAMLAVLIEEFKFIRRIAIVTLRDKRNSND